MDFSLVVASGGYSVCNAWASHCGDFSCCGAWALGAGVSVVAAPRLQSTGSTVVPNSLSCSKACGISLDQGSNPCLLHWQANSYPWSASFNDMLKLFF